MFGNILVDSLTPTQALEYLAERSSNIQLRKRGVNPNSEKKRVIFLDRYNERRT